jgi:signal transduction histidine kinase/ligand-binding sensor domain-containing protein
MTQIKRITYRLILCVIGVISGCFVASAQYRFDSWTADTGLPQNYIKDILQSRDGYLWFTTGDGLVRFDGVKFTVFDKANSPGLNSNRLWIVYEDPAGDLWVSTEDGRIIRRHKGTFSTYGPDAGLSGRQVASLDSDVEGRLVVSAYDDRIVRQWSDGKFVPFSPTANLSPAASLSGQLNSGLFCSTDQMKLWCYINGRAIEWSWPKGLQNVMLMPGTALGKDGSVWAPLANLGVLRIEPGKAPRAYTEKDGLPGKPIILTTGARLVLLSRDAQNAYWLTDLETMQSQSVGLQVPNGIDTSLKAYADREGNIWFGTIRDGVFRARPQSVKSLSLNQSPESNVVYPIYEDRNGVVWIGTNEGLFRYENGKVTQDRDIGNHSIMSIGENASGQVIVTSFDTVSIQEGDRFTIKLRLPGVIWCTHAEDDGSLWFGYEKGLVRFKDNQNTFYSSKDGLAGDDVKVIISDNAGGLWIGSYGGLTHYKDGQFRKWTERDGLPSDTVRALYQDRDGVLWIGTYDGGLGRFKDGKFTRYTINEGLFNNGVFQILEDRRGNFWMSSNRGVFRANRQELTDFADGKISSITSVGYGKSDGMLNAECNGGRWPAGVATRDGKLLFPTQHGVALIDPNTIPINSQPPPVLIETFLVDRSPVAIDGEVQIRPDQESFEIQYTALSFLNAENIRFRYRLEGLDNKWTEAGTRREAYFSHIPPGSYTFRVIAANSDGVWNTEGALVRLVVYPRFYRTWWFLSLAVLSFVGLAVAAYKVRINQLDRARRKQEEFSRKLLESQERERQRIAAELHDTLGQSLLIIKNRVALAQSDIDERETVEEQLDELSHSASSAIEECREIAYNLRPYQIARFGLTRTLNAIFMRLNEVTGIQATAETQSIDDLLADEAQTNVYRVVQECVNNIIKHSQATEASFVISHNDHQITLMIQDNGRGFKSVEPQKEDRSGFGLLGIAERVKMLGGTLQIDSSNGTRIQIQIPVTPNRPDATALRF